MKEIVQEKNGASAVVLADKEILTWPTFKGLEKVSLFPKSDIRLFGKPTARPYRRMGVVLTFGDEEVIDLVDKAKSLASMIEIQ